MDYNGKHVLVLGLGESGLAMTLWLVRCGARVRVADTRVAPERLPQLQAAVPGIEFIAGTLDIHLLDGIDMIAVSPGLSPLLELAALTAAALLQGIPMVGEIELFAQALRSLKTSHDYAPKIVAITGTNGKTTVTRLTGLLCEKSGLRVQVAGNISPAVLDVLRLTLDAGEQLPQVWVLELSSFQLHHTRTLAADAATVLNISQDHLDWHGTLAAYLEAKARIFSTDTIRVLNRDDAAVMQCALPLMTVVTFGVEPGTQAHCFGLVEDNGMQWLSMAVPANDDGVKKRKKGDTTPLPVLTNRLMPVDALKIRGRHNAVNALAALALCRAIGLPLAPLLHGLRDYEGEPHRVELVTTIDSVRYYDDSKGTNVGATVAALTGLGEVPGQAGTHHKHLWLIAGGEGKGQDFTPLAAPVARYVRSVLLIGRDRSQIRAALTASGATLIDCATLDEAVAHAAAHASAGDSVLLSPACASFDMFSGYEHRARVFVNAVREVACARGEVLV